MMDVRMRRAIPGEGAEIGALLDATRRVSMPYLPILHTPEELVEFAERRMLARWETWIALVSLAPDQSRIVGTIALNGEHVEQLFVLPAYQRRGIGGRLIDLAKQRRPDGLTLWVFQANIQARAFYDRHGFRVVRTTEDQNEERMPDMLLSWSPEP